MPVAYIVGRSLGGEEIEKAILSVETLPCREKNVLSEGHHSIEIKHNSKNFTNVCNMFNFFSFFFS